MTWKRKDLISMKDVDAGEIGDVLDTAESMREIAELTARAARSICSGAPIAVTGCSAGSPSPRRTSGAEGR